LARLGAIMLLTISGLSGSGKTTVASGLSERLGFAHVSAGEVFRELSRQRSLSLQELSALAEAEPEIDKMIDRRQAELAQSHDNVVVDGRLSGWVLKADMAVWLKAPLEVRAQRIALREGKKRAVALRETQMRDASEASRYRAFYNIDVGILDVFDLVIDTQHWDQSGVIDIILQAARTRRNDQ
jgi:cytidylate kinase